MSYFKKSNTENLEGIEEVVVSAVGGDLEIIGVDEPAGELFWEAVWSKENSNAEVVRDEKKLILRFDDKGSSVKFFGITITTSGGLGVNFGDLRKATIKIPRSVLKDISIKTISGDVEAERLKADNLTFSTSSGDVVNKESVSKSLTASTKSGDIKCADVHSEEKTKLSSISGDIRTFSLDTKDLDFTTKSGDVKMDPLSDKISSVKGSNVSGDIAIRNLSKEAKLTTVSGDIMLKCTKTGKTSWRFKSVSGDIDVICNPIDALITFDTVSGEYLFKNKKPMIKEKNHFVFGSGEEGRIDIKTVSGSMIFKTADIEEEKGKAEKEFDETVETGRKQHHDPDAERIVYTCQQGIITEEEAYEMLRILDYSDDEINRLMLDLGVKEKEENEESEEENE